MNFFQNQGVEMNLFVLFYFCTLLLSTHKKGKFEPLRSNIHLSVFTQFERGVAGQPVLPHSFSKFKNKYMTSFLYSLPGSA